MKYKMTFYLHFKSYAHWNATIAVMYMFIDQEQHEEARCLHEVEAEVGDDGHRHSRYQYRDWNIIVDSICL